MTLRGSLVKTLRAAGLTLPVYRAYETLQRVDYRTLRRNRRLRRSLGPDEPPLPPESLVVLVAGTPDLRWFLDSGARTAQAVRALLARDGRTIEEVASLLDFGCGCGRVMRHWRSLSGARLVGTDYNRRLIDWCRVNLPFAEFTVNELAPPLPFAGDGFDLIHSFSVFTHLPAELQQRWIDELSRVLRPGGHLVLTTHGERFLPGLSAEEQERFRAGSLVVQHAEVAGTNLCAAFHPRAYLEGEFAGRLRVVDMLPGGTVEGIEQDMTLLRKPS